MSLVGFRARNHPQQPVKEWVDDRETAPEEFAPLHQRFGFTVDVAASEHNAKLRRYYTPHEDGLKQSWTGERVWCNPPYSNIRPWIVKAWLEWARYAGNDGAPPELIVMLLPANRTEQAWWQELVEPELREQRPDFRCEFLPGRMRFIRPGAVIDPRGDRPPFGCCLLIWGWEQRGAGYRPRHGKARAE